MELQKVLGHVEDLGRELSCWRDYEHSGPVFLREAGLVEVFYGRNQEGQGFARAGLGGSEHVPALQKVRDGFGLKREILGEGESQDLDVSHGHVIIFPDRHFRLLRYLQTLESLG